MSTRTLSWALGLASVFAAISPVFADDSADVLAIVTKYSDAFSRNDIVAADSLCTHHAIIIDDFPPHVWQGSTTCVDWWHAMAADSKASGIAGGVVALGKPWRVTVTADRAYAVFPATYTYRRNGVQTVSNGVWTFALLKLAAGWRIAGWAWSLQGSTPTVTRAG
jgi:hypothetical protein